MPGAGPTKERMCSPWEDICFSDFPATLHRVLGPV